MYTTQLSLFFLIFFVNPMSNFLIKNKIKILVKSYTNFLKDKTLEPHTNNIVVDVDSKVEIEI
jgi:heme O synthase-like polyprenyltransferase